MIRFDDLHEQVTLFNDPETDLKAIVAIHDTTLGPALGGTRFFPYPDIATAVHDALRLSHSMTYKHAVAGLKFGGGKAVIIGDPDQLKSHALLRVYGQFLETFGGSYITAGDAGINADDLDIISHTTEFVVGRPTGSHDTAAMTALGVLHAMRAAACIAWGAPSLAERVVGVEGAGRVGYQLITLLIAEGARIIASDVDAAATERVSREFPQIRISPDVTNENLDIYAPCAVGSTLTDRSSVELRADIVCGAANNQLTHPVVEHELVKRGIVWVPDYVANAGGVICASAQHLRTPTTEMTSSLENIFDTVSDIFATVDREGISAGAAAETMARQRISAARRG